jgi:hypothetical protein
MGKEGPNTLGSSAAPPPLVTEQSIISPSGRHGEICEFTHDQHTCSKPQITVNVSMERGGGHGGGEGSTPWPWP